ncbi:MAG: endonuclease MutS2 [Lachnospiraceae bacterium]|nr:MAG: endonuclease MutS2 [Lachnospiraceae bacterium]
MNKKVLHTLEFDKIIERLAAFATSDKGREYCRLLNPISDIDKIRVRQKETGDALQRLFKKGDVSFSGIHDPYIYKKRLEIGSSMNTAELLSVVSLLTVASRIKKYGEPGRTETKADSLTHYFNELDDIETLRNEISRCIVSEDEIASDASPALRAIRRQIGLMGDRIHSKMTELLNSQRDYLSDSVITMRDGRYCLPVKSEHKSSVPGMVHDQSGSGATLFIEPAAVVSLNNELRELQLSEQEEIKKILKELSEKVYEYIGTIVQDFKILAELDFIFAKGKLAQSENAMEPLLNTDGRIDLRKARHPLLDPKKVVPIDVNLGKDFDVLVVTGPNTGGKTVSLKTVGLLTLMACAGLFIPAADRSEIAVFNDVYADIGDEQSIEQSLSTFSSHMTNIVSILRQVHMPQKAERTALVLFDELCAGTDPAEGAALAESILDELHRERIRTMATTHYPELKAYALTTPRVENASLEFSVETLSPTYRLLIGVPGKSNAFEISKKLGLSEDIIEDAASRMKREDQNFEDLVTGLEQKQSAVLKAQDKASKAAAEAEALLNRAKQKDASLSDRSDAILAKANAEAAEILQRAKDQADTVIRNFNKYGTATPDMAEMERQRSALGESIKAHQGKAAVKPKKTTALKGKKADAKKLRIGDDVIVLSMNLRGTVHTLPDARGNLTVQMGILQSKVNINDIALVDEPSSSSKKRSGGSRHSMSKASTISPELMLIGMNSDEAIRTLDKYLDDARLSHLSQVRIVHGKGSGILRKAVHNYLAKQKDIKDYHLAAYGEGDTGVTIVEF